MVQMGLSFPDKFRWGQSHSIWAISSRDEQERWLELGVWAIVTESGANPRIYSAATLEGHLNQMLACCSLCTSLSSRDLSTPVWSYSVLAWFQNLTSPAVSWATLQASVGKACFVRWCRQSSGHVLAVFNLPRPCVHTHGHYLSAS